MRPVPTGGCREAATSAVREYVRATADGGSASLDEIELTMDHFERALDDVDPSSDDRQFGRATEPAGTRPG